MKTGIWIAAGLALAGAAVYFLKFRKAPATNVLPQKQNERRHLTNIFSKAKDLALGN